VEGDSIARLHFGYRELEESRDSWENPRSAKSRNAFSNGTVVIVSGYISKILGKELAMLDSISEFREWSEATRSWISQNVKL
jgi:hypothetical protein